MESTFEDMCGDIDSCIENNIDLSGSDFDLFKLEGSSLGDDCQMFHMNGSSELSYVDNSFMDFKFTQCESPYSVSSQELFQDAFLGVENDSPIVEEPSASCEHNQACLMPAENHYPGQSLNLELQSSPSLDGFNCSSPLAVVDCNYDENQGCSSMVNASCATDDFSSSFKSCVLNCGLEKCKVVSCPSDSISSYSECVSQTGSNPTENMVAPLALPAANVVVEIPKLNTEIGYHVAPLCKRGKTAHSFGACSPFCATEKPTQLQFPQENLVGSSSNVTSIYRGSNLNSSSNEEMVFHCGRSNNSIGKVPLKLSSANCKVNLSSVTKPKRIIKVKKSEAFQSKSMKKLEDLPFWSLKHQTSKSVRNSSKRRKCKAYQLEPLPDPKLERCRRNAINAKKNREAKKELINTLQQDLLCSREENQSMQNRVQCLELQVEQLMTAFKKLQEEKQLASALADQLQAENLSLQDQLKIRIHCN